MSTDPLSIEAVNDLLPQTQCGQCGFKGCRPYAEALLAGSADINQCPPGGAAGIAALAAWFGVASKPLNPAFGTHKPRSVAVIIEEKCIGCVKCINACPVDAILGAAKAMHTVIADECTGCELCIAPCPVDCIIMQPLTPQPTQSELQQKAQQAKQRYNFRLQRKEQEQAEQRERAQRQKAALAQFKTTPNA